MTKIGSITVVSARDRQDAMLGWLSRRAVTTVGELAERFEVSERTAHRDLAALRRRGVDVVGDPGRGGGVRVDPGQVPRSVSLETDELAGVYVALALARRATALPFGSAADRALDKLVGSLPKGRARELRKFLSRVVVGRPATESMMRSHRPGKREIVTTFERAFTAGCGLSFQYVDRDGRRTRRRIEPHGLLVNPPLWYVLAHDLVRDAPRMFRMDRMSGPRVLDDVTFTPRPLPILEQLIVSEAR